MRLAIIVTNRKNRACILEYSMSMKCFRRGMLVNRGESLPESGRYSSKGSVKSVINGEHRPTGLLLSNIIFEEIHPWLTATQKRNIKHSTKKEK